MRANVIDFEEVKRLYKEDNFFSKVLEECVNCPYREFILYDDFLFNNNPLCISDCYMHWKVIEEVYNGGLSGHFGQDKIIVLVKNQFY
jgi:hypothetical protein